MINNIIDYVKEACGKPENVFSPSFFDEHLLIVSEYCESLSTILSADREILSISAYLHDISVILDIKTLATHNFNSSDIAESLLRKYNYPENKIERVKQCIINHVTPVRFGEGNAEDIVLSNADAISQIVNPNYWLYFVYKVRNMNYEDGRRWYLNRIDTNWDLLIEPAKNLIEDKYMHIKKCL